MSSCAMTKVLSALRLNRYGLRSVVVLSFLAFLALTAGLQAQEGLQQIANLGQCKLESGQAIEDCRVGYRTYGHLNAAADNAVLVPTWL